MSLVNRCLKWVFIVFNALFALTGIGFVALAHGSGMAAEMKNEVGNFWTLSLFGLLTAGISILGVYGAFREKEWALTTFSILVFTGMFICLTGAFGILTKRPMISRRLEDFLKSDVMSKHLQQLQEEYKLECCGTENGYQDWSSKVPESCVCPESYHNTPKCEMVAQYESQYWPYEKRPSYTQVFREPCLPLLMRAVNALMDATVGVQFGLAIVGLIGAVMASLINRQIKKKRTTVQVPIFDNSMPPAYNELYAMKSMSA